jgi:hypothetical protein
MVGKNETIKPEGDPLLATEPTTCDGQLKQTDPVLKEADVVGNVAQPKSPSLGQGAIESSAGTSLATSTLESQNDNGYGAPDVSLTTTVKIDNIPAVIMEIPMPAMELFVVSVG